MSGGTRRVGRSTLPSRHVELLADGPPDGLGIIATSQRALDRGAPETREHMITRERLRVGGTKLPVHPRPELGQPHPASVHRPAPIRSTAHPTLSACRWPAARRPDDRLRTATRCRRSGCRWSGCRWSGRQRSGRQRSGSGLIARWCRGIGTVRRCADVLMPRHDERMAGKWPGLRAGALPPRALWTTCRDLQCHDRQGHGHGQLVAACVANGGTNGTTRPAFAARDRCPPRALTTYGETRSRPAQPQPRIATGNRRRSLGGRKRRDGGRKKAGREEEPVGGATRGKGGNCRRRDADWSACPPTTPPTGRSGPASQNSPASR
jgi:hypothetical protein